MDAAPDAVSEDAPANIVQATDLDIATRTDRWRMKISAVGRRRFQKVHLWGENNKTTARQFEPGDETDHELPQPDELHGNEDTKEYLEVGIVIGENPRQGLQTGSSRGAEHDAARLHPAPLERAVTAMRVFTPVTDYILSGNKYYVGCKRSLGRLNPRLISIDCVFIYPEFHEGISGESAKKALQVDLQRNIAKAAAINKTHAERVKANIYTTQHMVKKVEGDTLQVEKSESLISMLVLEYSLFCETKDTNYLKNMKTRLEKAAPDLKLKFGPNTDNTGVSAFFRGDQFGADEAVSCAAELKRARPDLPDLNPVLIEKVFQLMKKHDLIDELPKVAMAFFFESCQDELNLDFADNVLKTQIQDFLKAARRHAKHSQRWTTSKEAPCATKGDALPVISATKDTLKQICELVQRYASQLSEQHGGVLQSVSVGKLVGRLGTAIDVASQKQIWEELGAFHGAQYAAAHLEVGRQIEELVELLERVEVVYSKS